MTVEELPAVLRLYNRYSTIRLLYNQRKSKSLMILRDQTELETIRADTVSDI